MARGSRPQLHVAAHGRTASRRAFRQSASPGLKSRPTGSDGRRVKQAKRASRKIGQCTEVSVILRPCAPPSTLTALVWINPASCGHLHVVPAPSPQYSAGIGGVRKKAGRFEPPLPYDNPEAQPHHGPLELQTISDCFDPLGGTSHNVSGLDASTVNLNREAVTTSNRPAQFTQR